MSLSELYEKAVRVYEEDRPFVLYSKPGSGQVCLLEQADSQLHYLTDFCASGFVMAPFYSDEKPVLLQPDKLSSAHHMPIELQAPDMRWVQPVDLAGKDKHMGLVEDAVKRIIGSELDKIVLSRPISIPYDHFPLHAFHRLAGLQQNAFCYLWYHPEVGLWLGASPELLLRAHGNQLQTFSVAGTLAYESGKDPLWSQKEKEEQAIVTDYILSQLADLSIDATVKGPISYRAGKLWHLKTEIEAGIQQKSLQEIVSALHPTPAICGFPREQAMEYIMKNEDYDRKYYSGYLGELNLAEAGDCSLFVNLRCMEWDKQLAIIYVGGGITDKSLPEDEWKETEQKSRTILDALLN